MDYLQAICGASLVGRVALWLWSRGRVVAGS